MNRAPAAVLAGLSLAVLAACAPAAEPVPTPTVTLTAEAADVARVAAPSPPANPIPDVVFPLTGEDASQADADALAQPALSIKIENSLEARPQDGLEHADIVFEEYVEAGISRLVAIFHSDVPEVVGPIRSMRPMDRNIMGSFGGPLVFSGAQSGFIYQTRNSGQMVIAQDVGSPGFYRVSGRYAPHNLWGTTSSFQAQASSLDAPDLVWDFAYPPLSSPTAVESGSSTRVIDIYMSGWTQPEWTWDGDAHAWMRTEKGVPMQTVSGTQVSATNVLILFTRIQWNSSGGGSSVPETIVVTDSGTGYVATGGKYVPVEWSKAGQFDPYVVTTTDGDPVLFETGNTWVELVPAGGVATGSVDFLD